MPPVLSNVLALFGALLVLFLTYAYATRWRQRNVAGRLPGTSAGRWLWPVTSAIRALGRRSAIEPLATRRSAVLACLTCLPPVIGILMLWADMALPTCPWLLTAALPGFSHDLIWHLVWFCASLLFLLLWARTVPPGHASAAETLATVGVASVPVSLVGMAGAVWLLGTTHLAETGRHAMTPLPVILLQPLGLAASILALWLGARRTWTRPMTPDSPWADGFQWQHAGAAMAWLHLAQFVQEVYAAGLIVAVFGGAARLFGVEHWGWFLLKIALLLVGMWWLEPRWLARRARRPAILLGWLAALALANLALTAALLAWRLGP